MCQPCSLREPSTAFHQLSPYSEWDPWEKENLAGADFPVMLNVDQWPSGRCVSPELVTS